MSQGSTGDRNVLGGVRWGVKQLSSMLEKDWDGNMWGRGGVMYNSCQVLLGRSGDTNILGGVG